MRRFWRILFGFRWGHGGEETPECRGRLQLIGITRLKDGYDDLIWSCRECGSKIHEFDKP